MRSFTLAKSLVSGVNAIPARIEFKSKYAMRATIAVSSGSGCARKRLARQTTPMMLIFKTRIQSCRIAVRAEVGPFCRKGLRSVAATCDQTCFDSKIMSPEITAQHFVLRCCIPLTVLLAAKVLSGRKDLQKSLKHIAVKLLFPYATGRRSTTGLLEQVP